MSLLLLLLLLLSTSSACISAHIQAVPSLQNPHRSATAEEGESNNCFCLFRLIGSLLVKEFVKSVSSSSGGSGLMRFGFE